MKTIFISFLVIASLATSGYKIYSNAQDLSKESLSGITLDNVEALARGEGSGFTACCPDPGDFCEADGYILRDFDEC